MRSEKNPRKKRRTKITMKENMSITMRENTRDGKRASTKDGTSSARCYYFYSDVSKLSL